MNKSQMQPMLREIADHFEEMESPNNQGTIPASRYTFDEDAVLNATRIFAHVIGNVSIHKKILTNGKSIYDEIESTSRAEVLGEVIINLVETYTGFAINSEVKILEET